MPFATLGGMDMNQLSQLVTYLDTERRRDRQMLVQMQERVEGLVREVESRTRHAAQLETQVSELKLQAQRSAAWTAAFEQLRAEVGSSIERIEEQRAKGEREGSRMRQIEIETIIRQLNELRKDVKPYPSYNEAFEVRRLEDARLAELIGKTQLHVTDLERRLEVPSQSIAYLEEQRRQDNKRLLSLEQDLNDARKRMENYSRQALLIDEAARRKSLEIEEAAKLLEAQSQTIEAQRVSEIRRERQFAEYAELVEQMKERSATLSTQVANFTLMREEIRRVIGEASDVEARLEARFNELFEIQRDSADKARRIASEFRDTVLKDWHSFEVSQDQHWADHDRREADFTQRYDALEETVARASAQIEGLYDILDQWAKTNAEASRAWLAQSNTVIDKARADIPSEIKLSRRQRKKIETQRQVDARPPSEPDLIA